MGDGSWKAGVPAWVIPMGMPGSDPATVQQPNDQAPAAASGPASAPTLSVGLGGDAAAFDIEHDGEPAGFTENPRLADAAAGDQRLYEVPVRVVPSRAR